jgi:hypothetical protein
MTVTELVAHDTDTAPSVHLTTADYSEMAERLALAVQAAVRPNVTWKTVDRGWRLEITLDYWRANCADRLRLVARASSSGLYLFIYEGWEEGVGEGFLVGWSVYQSMLGIDDMVIRRSTSDFASEGCALTWDHPLLIGLTGHDSTLPSLVDDVVSQVRKCLAMTDLT